MERRRNQNPLNGNCTQNGWGRLTAVQYQDENTGDPFSYMYSYNAAGRVTAQHMNYNGNAVSFDAAYSWDTEGRMTGIDYGNAIYPQQYTMQYDANGRLGGMTSGANTLGTASYGVAGEMLGFTYTGSAVYGHTETRTYNAMLQLTRQTVVGGLYSALGTGTAMDMQYVYPGGANNGRIGQTIDGVSGETVNYTYDALNRLAGAGATNGSWGQAFTYDGFGNLTGKSVTQGSAPVLSVSVDPATNWVVGQTYDANGNAGAGVGYMYDVENRMLQGPGGATYVYDHAGKRVKKANGTSWEYYFYGVGGQKLVTLPCTSGGCTAPQYNVYFGGKLVMSKGAVVVTDRLGSVRASGGERMSYYPYGEEKTSTGDGREKFGTYTRDNVGQDYADQRYYAVGMGRFNTADPYRASAGPRDPSSWNRFSYVQGDPVNFTDPRGLEVYNPSYCPPEDENCEGPDGQPGDAAGGGGSWGPCDPLWGQQFAEVPDAACYAPPEPPPPPAKPKRKPPCNPGFLDPNTTYTGADGYSFTGKDIDYAARASNNAAEQTAGADVIYNRVDDPAFRTNGHMEETLTAVVRAPHQFNAVTSPGPNRKFRQSGPDRYKYLNPADCAGLRSAVQSMLSVVTNGATADYDFFAAANATTQGTLIGQTRFW